jgi:hypothetical protein
MPYIPAANGRLWGIYCSNRVNLYSIQMTVAQLYAVSQRGTLFPSWPIIQPDVVPRSFVAQSDAGATVRFIQPYLDWPPELSLGKRIYADGHYYWIVLCEGEAAPIWLPNF